MTNNPLAGHSSRFSLLAACFLLISCACPPKENGGVSGGLGSSGHVMETMVHALASKTSAVVAPADATPTAHIVGILNGGPAGDWSVEVKFPLGAGSGCNIDVIERRTGTLLARDRVDGDTHSHTVRFRFRGRLGALVVQVIEVESGAVLAEQDGD